MYLMLYSQNSGQFSSSSKIDAAWRQAFIINENDTVPTLKPIFFLINTC